MTKTKKTSTYTNNVIKHTNKSTKHKQTLNHKQKQKKQHTQHQTHKQTHKQNPEKDAHT